MGLVVELTAYCSVIKSVNGTVVKLTEYCNVLESGKGICGRVD